MKNRYSLFKKGYWEAGVLLGLCLLIASCGEKEFTTDMPENKLITAISLEVSSELPVQLGTDTTIVYHITPENADHTELKWTTTNELVATVSQDGTISAKSLGKTMITVTPSVGFGTASTVRTIEVTVIPEVIKTTGIQFTNIEEGVYETDKLQLKYDILPADHTYSYLTWASSNENIATVDKNGVVTGIKAGDVTIYAYTHDGSNVRGEYSLKVMKYEPATNVEIVPHTDVLYWKQQLDLDFTLTPEVATVSSVEWTSSDEKVLTVEGGKVKAMGFGAAQDIKYQKISTEYLLAGSCAAILYRALFGRMHWSVWVAGLGCGIVFLMISKWSQEGIGYGDSWMILNMGIFLGIWNLLGMLMLAFLVAAMAAGAGLWSGKWKRTTRMSFYPFLLIGYLGTFIW